MTNREWVLNKMQSMSDDELIQVIRREKFHLCSKEEMEKCYGKSCNECNTEWLKAEHKEKITLSEAERVILENIDKDYKWIARECDGELWIYASKPVWLKDEKAWWNTSNNKSAASLYLFNHLFDFIKYEDEKTYNIENLLKGEI